MASNLNMSLMVLAKNFTAVMTCELVGLTAFSMLVSVEIVAVYSALSWDLSTLVVMDIGVSDIYPPRNGIQPSR